MSLFRASIFAVLLPVAAGAALTATPRDASASVSIAILFDDLVRETQTVDVVTPIEAHALWENGRIYTYTRVHVDRAVAGEFTAGREEWVRTLGGVVGKIGQVVDGEPVLTVGRPAMLFLRPGPPGAFEVTGRAQGQFPVVTDETKTLRVVRSIGVGALLTATKPLKPFVPAPAPLQSQAPTAKTYASDMIHDRVLDEVAVDVSSAWKRIHGAAHAQ